MENLQKILKNVKKGQKLIFNLTNYVSVNDIANLILLTNNSPIMSTQIDEVQDLVNICDGVCINIGTATKNDFNAMLSAANFANKNGKILTLDPVGAGSTSWRNDCVKKLLKTANFDVICCNISEYEYISLNIKNENGVDANKNSIANESNLNLLCKNISKSAKKYQTIFVVHGKYDIISDGTKTCVIKNGTSLMKKITGMGCMLNAFINVFVTNNKEDKLNSCILACAIFAKSGELCYEKNSSISFFKQNIFSEIENIIENQKINIGYNYEFK